MNVKSEQLKMFASFVPRLYSHKLNAKSMYMFNT